ncbi:hypothetical protein DICPUDRAFT_93072 [Dictyostelium purpureum]|uniref:Dickkopf N-terminal cysteine-rich domain-containing protein n=1 Tax=Dictyostelium purpureum TaxID=5786 RepID=F1A1L3_DICPU|nr:uncharacterized protein DICPUDRAFT_93072 [Dictyostelium purpureum]EGC29918.1 hypothetical protein DICPUDRAFT_93072 [Dictyostelium purpureum]|eukprot:XP_003293559.1 hypothetical protein DICPUDRAFT_93072 [Dictyostelium purpureum]
MKVIVIFIILIQIHAILSYDLCFSNPKKLPIGSKCQHHSDCQLPLFCGSSGTCSKPIDNDNDKCNDNRECGPYRVCQNSHCKDILNVGEACDDKSYCSSSSCINGKCAIDDRDCCISQETCRFNQYCSMASNEAKNATGKCKPVGSEGSKCTIDNQCPITHFCVDGQCIKKYSKPLAATCKSSRECSVFKGHICDAKTNKCVVYKEFLKNCSSTSECGTGMCMCKSEGDNVCVDVQVGALKSDNCLSYLDSFASCMKREGCLHNTPHCPKCFSIWMSYQYECFYINQFYRSGSEYYKSFWLQQPQKKLPIQQKQ